MQSIPPHNNLILQTKAKSKLHLDTRQPTKPHPRHVQETEASNISPSNIIPRSTPSTNPRTPSTQNTTTFTPPTMPSRSQRRPAPLNLTSSPPESLIRTTSSHFEHDPITTGPLADFARTPLYPPLTLHRRAFPLQETQQQPSSPSSHALRRSRGYSNLQRPNSTTTTTTTTTTTVRTFPPPELAHLSLSTQQQQYPRRYNDLTNPNARPTPASVPARPPIDADRQFVSSSRQRVRRYRETFSANPQRPTAVDQLTAEVNAMLGHEHPRYEELPGMVEREGEAEMQRGLSARRRPGEQEENLKRDYRVVMALVPDFGLLGLILPFPEPEGEAEQQQQQQQRGEDVELEELTKGMAALSIEDDDAEGSPERVRPRLVVLQPSTEFQEQEQPEQGALDPTDLVAQHESQLAEALTGPDNNSSRIVEPQSDSQVRYFQTAEQQPGGEDAASEEEAQERDSWGLAIHSVDYEQEGVNFVPSDELKNWFHPAQENLAPENPCSFALPGREESDHSGEQSPRHYSEEQQQRDSWSYDPAAYERENSDANDQFSLSSLEEQEMELDSWGLPTHGQGTYEQEEEEDEEGTPQYILTLRQVNLTSLLDLPAAEMHVLLTAARDADPSRNARILAICELRSALEERKARRAMRCLRMGADRAEIEEMQVETNLLYFYDRHHWPSLEPLEYDEDGEDEEEEGRVVQGAGLRMRGYERWNPYFNWAEPFEPRKGRRGGGREERVREVPVSPKTTTVV